MTKDIIQEAQRLFLAQSYSTDEPDQLLDDAIKLIVQHEKASASLLQRRLSVGYARAARLLDQLESVGVIGPAEGSQPRDVLVSSYEEYKNGISKKTPQQDAETELNLNTQKYIHPDWKKTVRDGELKKILTQLSSPKNTSNLSISIGWSKDTLIKESLLRSPHIIITGNPTSNKYAYLDTVLLSLLIENTPDEFRLILLDGANYFHQYDKLAHLLAPVTSDADKGLAALRWGIAEIEHRLQAFKMENKKNISEHNKTNENLYPHILYVITQIDEYMSYAPHEIYECLKRITSVGHRVGVHLLLTTDLITSKSIPTEIQENISLVIQFKATLKSNTRPQAAVLLPADSLLYKTDFMDTWDQLKAPLITDDEMQHVLDLWKKQK